MSNGIRCYKTSYNGCYRSLLILLTYALMSTVNNSCYNRAWMTTNVICYYMLFSNLYIPDDINRVLCNLPTSVSHYYIKWNDGHHNHVKCPYRVCTETNKVTLIWGVIEQLWMFLYQSTSWETQNSNIQRISKQHWQTIYWLQHKRLNIQFADCIYVIKSLLIVIDSSDNWSVMCSCHILTLNSCLALKIIRQPLCLILCLLVS